MKPITVGLLVPSPQDADNIKVQLKATGIVVTVESYEQATSPAAKSSLRFVEANPDMIILESDDGQALLQSLQTLHSLLPNTWILVSSGLNDSELIINCIRGGAREFLTKPLSVAAASQTFGRYMAEKERQAPQARTVRGKIYAVLAAKSGTGGTTVAINLAAAISEFAGARVALVDLDRPLGDIAAYLNIKPQFTMEDALGAGARLDPVLLGSFMNYIEGVNVLAGKDEFQNADPGQAGVLSQTLEVIATAHTHTVLDLSPTLGREQLQAIAQLTSAMIVVVTPDLSSIWRSDRLIRLLSSLDTPVQTRLLLNRYRKNADITEKEVEKALRQRVEWTIANDYGSCQNAVNAGRPVVKMETNQVAREFRDFARQLTGFKLPEKKRGFTLFPKLSSTQGMSNV